MTSPPRESDDTIVRLPLLPSPAEMTVLRAERAHIEEQLRSGTVKALDDVGTCAAALGQASEALDQAVALARAAGASWPEIGRQVGISRQAAAVRWGNREDGPDL